MIRLYSAKKLPNRRWLSLFDETGVCFSKDCVAPQLQIGTWMQASLKDTIDMPNAQNYPTHYSTYVGRSAITRKTAALPLLARFCNRYRLAESFKGMDAPDVGNTLEGYDVLTKIFLAYTAYEAVVKAARKLYLRDISDMTLNASLNPKLAARLRENTKLMTYLATQPFKPENKNKISLFISGDTSDIVCVAYGLRNTFAHGDLTASAVGTRKKQHRTDLLDLADGILDYSDALFNKCIDRLR